MWDDLLAYLWIVWLVSSLPLAKLYVCILAYRSKLIPKNPKERFETPNLIFQVTTKGGMSIVQESVDRLNSVCAEIDYRKFEIWVVTDVEEKYNNCRTIVVPRNYSCNAIYKARALQYAVEVRELEDKNTNDIYVFHLDDESRVTKQALCSILTFLDEGPRPISEGLIVYPLRAEDRITMPNLLDALRPFYCFECLDFMSRGNPAYLHGSNLLVRSDIEEQVGWGNGKTFAEDALFAANARRKFGREIFGWHGGVIEEKSPFTIRDFAKQRKRWFYGLVQNLRFLCLSDKCSQIVRAFLWSVGFFSGLVSIIALFTPQAIPLFFRIGLFVATLLWLGSYQIGAFYNGKYLRTWKRLWFHILILIFSVVLGVIESLVPLLVLISPPKTFEVVKK